MSDWRHAAVWNGIAVPWVITYSGAIISMIVPAGLIAIRQGDLTS